MELLPGIIAGFTERFGARLRLPEHRQIELLHRKKRLSFRDADPGPGLLPDLFPSVTAFMLLEAFLESRQPELEGKAGWAAYQALPRRSDGDKVLAEIFRILRVLRTAIVSPLGHVALEDGLIRAFVTHNQCALSVTISSHGLTLLNSAVAYYLDAQHGPYGEAYVNAMLLGYFTDIVAEIRRFNDEDRVLFQFGRRLVLSRHLRLDCDSPRFIQGDGVLQFTLPERQKPDLHGEVDLFVAIDDVLYIIPVEALTEGALAQADLPRWQARSDLPADFALRFGREPVVVGQPMT